MATMTRRFEVFAAGVLGPWWVRDTQDNNHLVAGPFMYRPLAETEADHLNREN